MEDLLDALMDYVKSRFIHSYTISGVFKLRKNVVLSNITCPIPTKKSVLRVILAVDLLFWGNIMLK